MIEVQGARDAAPLNWDETVRRAGGTPFHQAGWARLAATDAREPWFLHLSEGESVVGYAIGEGKRSRWPIVRSWRSTLALHTTPALEPRYRLLDAIGGLRRFARREGFRQLVLAGYASLRPAETEHLAGIGFTAQPHLEFRVPLAASLEETLRGMSKKHRQYIRKTMKSGVSFREDSTFDGAMRLRELQESTYGRRHAQGQPRVNAMPLEQYRRTIAACADSGAMRFWFADHNGETLTGIAVLIFGERACYHLGGTSAAGYAARAPYAMFGHVIELLCGLGVRELNLGGVPDGAEQEGHPTHGLFQFKHGFGAEIVTCWHARGPA